MRKKSLEFLQALIAAPSPSGFESAAQQVWRNYADTVSDAVEYDYHGNSIAVLNGEAAPRIMLAGHCDELGFIVKYVDSNGFIYFSTIGGHDLSMVPGRRVVIHTQKGPIRGVTGKKAIHLMTPEERKKVPLIQNLWIDIGASSKEEVLEKVRIGDPVVYDVEFQPITDDIATSRAFDNKVGAFAVIEALRLLKNVKLKASVFSVATVQEEIGLRGARTSAFSVDPDIGIAIDVTHATDHPEVSKVKVGEVYLGKGPVINRGANSNHKVVELLIEAAEKEKIPYQLEATAGGTPTDANAIQLTRSGVATALISVPLRYMHTPSEVVSLSDVENTAKLLAAFIKRVTPKIDFRQ
ncbi:MAG: M42 family metallopeptidase [Calditrichota bacterium]